MSVSHRRIKPPVRGVGVLQGLGAYSATGGASKGLFWLQTAKPPLIFVARIWMQFFKIGSQRLHPDTSTSITPPPKKND